MFDLTSSKLLILAVVALIVVGPKELPGLLRTVGKYMSMIRRQANEFRAQFDDAMRETELAELKKDFEKLSQETKDTLNEAGRSLETQVGQIDQSVRDAAHFETPTAAGPDAGVTERAELVPAEPALSELPPPIAPVPAKPREDLVGATTHAGSSPAGGGA